MDFIYELYKNDNFTTYLLIALVVLVVLFIVVLIFGKKDQKLEETKRLQKIDVDAFKEEKKEPEKVEVVKEEVNIPEEKEPAIELPQIKTEEEIHVTDFEPDVENEELSSLLTDNEPTIKFDEEGLENDLQEIEKLKNEFTSIELPKVETTTEKTISKSNQEVFSSVYTPEPVEPKPTPVRNTYIDDDGEEIELPTLK